jgi:hypothetical protein
MTQTKPNTQDVVRFSPGPCSLTLLVKDSCQDKARQEKTRHDKTRQDKTKQSKTRQDKVRQRQARQDKTTIRQDNHKTITRPPQGKTTTRQDNHKKTTRKQQCKTTRQPEENKTTSRGKTTTRYNTTWHNTTDTAPARRDTAPARRDTAKQGKARQDKGTKCNTTQHNTIQHNTTQQKAKEVKKKPQNARRIPRGRFLCKSSISAKGSRCPNSEKGSRLLPCLGIILSSTIASTCQSTRRTHCVILSSCSALCCLSFF